MAAREIVPGVRRVRFAIVNAYVVEGDDGLTLVDTGTPRGEGRVRRTLREAGHRPGNLRAILITHAHDDHTGGLAALARETGAAVYAPAGDASFVREGRGRHPGRWSSPLARITGPLIVRVLPSGRPTEVDVEVADGDRLAVAGGVRAIHTPGHTAGHTSYLHEPTGVLFAGDAVGNLSGRPRPPTGPLLGNFTESVAEARRSFARLAALDYDVLCPGHGMTLRGDAARRVAEAAARG